MALSKKHCQEIADIIARAKGLYDESEDPERLRRYFAFQMSLFLKSDNSQFDRKKFLDAARVP